MDMVDDGPKKSQDCLYIVDHGWERERERIN